MRFHSSTAKAVVPCEGGWKDESQQQLRKRTEMLPHTEGGMRVTELAFFFVARKP